MPLPQFVDKNPFNTTTVYTVTNEECVFLNQLLGKRSFKKAGCVLSAGEVLLSVVLSRCKQVTAVDHSYGSIAVAYMKVLMLEKYGVKGFKQMLMDKPSAELLTEFQAVYPNLPDALQKNFKLQNSALSYGGMEIRREWYFLPEKSIERAFSRLDKVSFIHGDIHDLGVDGPLDLLYTSNAHEHVGRDGKAKTIQGFAQLIKPGGFLLCTTASKPAKTYEGLELVRAIRGIRTSWEHCLYKRV